MSRGGARGQERLRASRAFVRGSRSTLIQACDGVRPWSPDAIHSSHAIDSSAWLPGECASPVVPYNRTGALRRVPPRRLLVAKPGTEPCKNRPPASQTRRRRVAAPAFYGKRPEPREGGLASQLGHEPFDGGGLCIGQPSGHPTTDGSAKGCTKAFRNDRRHVSKQTLERSRGDENLRPCDLLSREPRREGNQNERHAYNRKREPPSANFWLIRGSNWSVK